MGTAILTNRFQGYFEHIHEAGSAVDSSTRCIHVFKSFLVFSQVDRIQLQKKAQYCRTLNSGHTRAYDHGAFRIEL